jgi:Tfp pilus assembly protein PilO
MTDIRRIVSENRRVVWIIAAALIVNAALYALVVYPLTQRVQAEQRQAEAATRDLNAARRAANAAKATVSGKKQADEELQKFYRDVLPANQSDARRTLYPRVDQLAQEADLSTGRNRISPQGDTDGGLSKLSMTMLLAGDYTSLRRFIHELETAPEFLVLESVAVTAEAEGDRRLNVTAQVATYYRGGTDGN